MTFQHFYDKTWLPKDGYFQTHRKRFQQSWEFLSSFLESRRFDPAAMQGNVYDVGGDGPVSDYIVTTHGWQLGWTDKDIRKRLPFEDSTFDIIVCLEVIEHIKDLDSTKIDELSAFNHSGVYAMLEELKRVINTGGYLLITTPNTDSYINFCKWLNHETLVMDPGHVREFSTSELLRVTCEAGFKCEKLVTINSWDEHLAESYNRYRSLVTKLPGEVDRAREDNIFAIFSVAESAG